MQTVENSLDTRGYCTRFTLCAYFATTIDKSHCVTLPPSNYPPTAPYANLSAHFAKLVKTGILKTQIVKMLLYPQARQSIDLNIIPMRIKRRHKSIGKKAKNVKNSDSNRSDVSSERSELERQDAFEIPTDSEDSEDSEGLFEEICSNDEEVCDDCASDAFEYVNMYRKRRKSIYDSSATFIDHGVSKDNTLAKQRHSSSINLLKISSPVCSELKKESLIIGSKAMQALARKSTESCIIMHTTTAELKLGQDGVITTDLDFKKDPAKLSIMPQQSSETSHSSSIYNGRGMGGVYLACENLSDLKDEKKIKQALVVPPTTDRHSMPNILVGNRFNPNPNAAVYLPTWSDRNDMQMQSVDVADCAVNAEQDQTHSSSLDLPASCLTAPDKMQAELLYNFDNFNSKEKKCEDETERQSAIRRCISHKFIHMNNNNVDLSQSKTKNDAKTNTTTIKKHENTARSKDHDNESNRFKCRCCASSQCPSPRSSDSGMAGSCTIASPDPPNAEAAYYYGGIGGLQFDEEQIDPARFDVCGNFRNNFLNNNNSTVPATTTTTTTTVPSENRCSTANMEEDLTPAVIFRSGMYAHWWKKETLPADVVNGIALATRANRQLLQKSQSSKSSICSSCQCSLRASGYSEGTNYCALCQDCAAYASLVAETQPTHTTTTNTTSSRVSCPLCSGDDMNLSDSFKPGVMTTPSNSSSIDCPICLRMFELGTCSSSSIESQAKAVKEGKQS